MYLLIQDSGVRHVYALSSRIVQISVSRLQHEVQHLQGFGAFPSGKQSVCNNCKGVGVNAHISSGKDPTNLLLWNQPNSKLLRLAISVGIVPVNWLRETRSSRVALNAPISVWSVPVR